MIFGNIRNVEDYSFLEEPVKECLHYWKEHNLTNYEKGSYEICGDRLFVNVVEYMTTTPENRFWEAHRDYLDVHMMIQGQERIDVNFIQNMQCKKYVSEEDFQPMEGEKNGFVVLEPGDFLVCFPSDAHRTAIAADAPAQVKKAIFKVRIS